MQPVPVDKVQFCRACGKFATGIAVLTVRGPQGAPHGMTVNSFTSVSLTPPLVLVAVDHKTRVLGYMRASDFFGINILAEDQQHLSEHFARSGQDRFSNVSWSPGKTGAPLIPGVLAYVECGLRQMVEAGDHTLFIGEVLQASWREGQPLLYFNSRYKHLR
ncbi:MAG: flavin reductase family protein [Bryobacterales bacterium]|nr:flavin reductase family protein [Bryobacterales bacterium]